jgi:pimeloyl-ACP methyl ester carboxylesterase
VDVRELRIDSGPVALAGTVRGAGLPILLLHGGPGLGVEYLEPLADELADVYLVAAPQQRGLAPSGTSGPFTVADHVDDVRRVLDALGWARATVVGHSWGGHLALHVAAALPERTEAVLAVDLLGAVGDGGSAEFEAELLGRLSPADRDRAMALDERIVAGAGTPDDSMESFRLVWPAYFADPAGAPEMPPIRLADECFVEAMASVERELPSLERLLPTIDMPVGFVIGAGSPMPATAATDTAERIPGAWVEVVPDAGHFVWMDAPGKVLAALTRLLGQQGT